MSNIKSENQNYKFMPVKVKILISFATLFFLFFMVQYFVEYKIKENILLLNEFQIIFYSILKTIFVLLFSYAILYWNIFLPLQGIQSLARDWVVGKTESRLPEQNSEEFEQIAHGVNLTIDELEDNLNKANQALEMAGDGVMELHLETGSVHISPGFWKILGWNETEVPTNISEVVQKFLDPDFPEVKTQLLESGLFQDPNFTRIEFSAVTKSGEKKWLLGRGGILDNHRKIKSKIRIGVLTDITELKTAQAGKEENAKRLDLAIQGANQGIWDLDLRSGKLIVSSHFVQMLGYGPDEMDETTQFWKDKIHPADFLNCEKAFDEYVAGRTSRYLVNFRTRTKNGRWKWIRSQGSIMERDPEGNPVRLLGTHIDITEFRRLRKRDEVRLEIQDKMEKGNSLLDLLKVPLRHLDDFESGGCCALFLLRNGDQGLDIITSGCFPETFQKGRLTEAVVGQNNFIKKGIQENVRNSLIDLSSLPWNDPFRDLAIQAGFQFCSVEPIVGSELQSQGILVFLHPKCDNVQEGDLEEIQFIGQMTKWIITRHESFRQLTQSELRFRTIFEGSTEGIVIAEVNSKKILFGNPAFCKMFNYSPFELQGLEIRKLHPDFAWNDVEVHFAACARVNTQYPLELPCLTKLGVIFYCRISPAPVHIDGKDVLIGFFSDITDRKNKEKELAKRNWLLGKRVMELRTVTEVTQLFYESEIPLEELFQRAAALISTGFQFPGLASTVIEFEGKRYHSNGEPPFLLELVCPVLINGKQTGSIIVGYPTKLPANEWTVEAFLPEETVLLKTVSKIIGDRITAKQIQANLLENRIDLLNAQKIASLGSWVWTSGSSYINGTPEFLKLIQWKDGNPTGEALLTRLHPSDRYQMKRAWFSAHRGRSFEIEVGAYLNGRKNWFRVLGEPALDDSGKLRSIHGVIQDITKRKIQEEQLYFQSDLLNEIGGLAKIGGWSYDIPTGEVTWTKEVYQIHECDQNREINADFALNFYTPLSRQKINLAIENAIKNQKSYDMELQIQTAKGECKWVRSIGHPIVKNGKVIQLHGAFQDIDQRVQERQAIERDRAFLRAMLSTLPDLVWFKDETGHYRFCNDRYAQLFGKTEEELLNQTDFDLTSEKAAVNYQKMDQEALQSSNIVQTEEWQVFPRDGHRELLDIRKIATFDQSGKLLGILGIGRDITVQHEAKESLIKFNRDLEAKVNERTLELAKKAQDLEMVVKSIPDTVLRLGDDGEILFSKISAEFPLHCDLSKSKDGDSFPYSVSQKIVPLCIKVGKESRSTNATGIAEVDLGENEVVELRVSSLANGEYLALIRDVSTKRKLDAEIQNALKKEKDLSAMKSRFISTASHEFRTPMAAVAGSVDLLKNFKDRLTPRKKEELLDRILSGIDRLKAIVDDVLNLSRVDSGKTHVNKTLCNLELIVRDLIGELEVADKENHEWSLVLEGDFKNISTDSVLITSILSNLLSNAVRFSPDGGLILIRLTRGPNQFQIRVQDEGIGIPQADREKLFEAFFRATNVGEIRGTGLGLNIVKRYTEILGGIIEFIPTDKGACFQGTYPLG